MQSFFDNVKYTKLDIGFQILGGKINRDIRLYS